MPGPISPDTLRRMIEKKDDTSFLVVDVRPSDQYRLDHIPGAVNIPVNQIGSRTIFPEGVSKVIFYCRNGMRSKVAAILAIDAGLRGDHVYNLDGGMAAYTGEIVLDLPRLSLAEVGPERAVDTALNLEKGAWRFYEKVADLGLRDETVRFLRQMATFETDHARSLFRRLENPARSFEAYFRDCPGDILEGGKSFDEVLPLLSGRAGEEEILDMALDIEVGAYDLYKRTASLCESESEKDFFLGLAAAEKTHMTMVLDFLSDRQ